MTDYAELRRQRMATLTPEQRAFFDKKRPPLRTLGVAGLREFGRAALGPPRPDPAVSWRDIAIEGPHGPIPTRIFTPTAPASGPRGIYLHTHGGGYVMWGGLDTTTNMNTQIAKGSHCIVVAPDFRLPPEHRFPVPLDDCFAAFQWTAANAERLGGRSDRIAVGGGCTGGNLAAAVSLLARDAGGPKVAAQYLIATVFDTRADYRSQFENDVGYSLSHDDCRFVYEQYLGDPFNRFDWRTSPILAPSLKGLPPTLIRVGEWDVLRDEGRVFAGRLRDAGVDVTYHEVPKESHGPTPWTAAEATAEMNAFLKKYVGGGK